MHECNRRLAVLNVECECLHAAFLLLSSQDQTIYSDGPFVIPLRLGDFMLVGTKSLLQALR
jgi:hypothetical protein